MLRKHLQPVEEGVVHRSYLRRPSNVQWGSRMQLRFSLLYSQCHLVDSSNRLCSKLTVEKSGPSMSGPRPYSELVQSILRFQVYSFRFSEMRRQKRRRGTGSPHQIDWFQYQENLSRLNILRARNKIRTDDKESELRRKLRSFVAVTSRLSNEVCNLLGCLMELDQKISRNK